MKDLQENFSKLVVGDVETLAGTVQIIALLLILFQTTYVLVKYHYAQKNGLVQYSSADVKVFFMSHFAIYIIYSLLITGAFISTYRIEQYLYIVNFIIIIIALPRLNPVFEIKEISTKKWVKNFLLVMLVIAVLALIAINAHGDLHGAHKRFDF